MSDRYEKLYLDDAARSRILQNVENADLDAYRDRPEYLQKERPELAEVGEPTSEKTRSGSFREPGFRKGMSLMLIRAFTIAAAAAVTLFIAIPLLRNSIKIQMPNGTSMQTSGEAAIQKPGEEKKQDQEHANLHASEPVDYSGEERSQEQEEAPQPAAECPEDNAAEPSMGSAASISSDLVIAAFRAYYNEAYSVELKEETSETVSLTVSRNTENGTDETLTVTADLTTGETVTLDEAGSLVETGTISANGLYTADS